MLAVENSSNTEGDSNEENLPVYIPETQELAIEPAFIPETQDFAIDQASPNRQGQVNDENEDPESQEFVEQSHQDLLDSDDGYWRKDSDNDQDEQETESLLARQQNQVTIPCLKVLCYVLQGTLKFPSFRHQE